MKRWNGQMNTIDYSLNTEHFSKQTLLSTFPQPMLIDLWVSNFALRAFVSCPSPTEFVFFRSLGSRECEGTCSVSWSQKENVKLVEKDAWTQGQKEPLALS